MMDGRKFAQGSVAAGALAGGATALAAAPQRLRGPNTDPTFNEPYLDADEWRQQPFEHRYVHGGFKGTDVRFVMYFPPKQKYQGRFFQPVPPVPTPEDVTIKMYAGTLTNDRVSGLENDRIIAFAFGNGAAVVASNLGGFTARSFGNQQHERASNGARRREG